MSGADFELWEKLKQTVQPLRQSAATQKPKLPPRLRVNKNEVIELIDTLDLHGLTIQQAFDILKHFLIVHERAGSRSITVITGKGLNSVGKIKSEFMLWMDTPFFKEKIRDIKWMNDGGAVTLVLRRKKK